MDKLENLVKQIEKLEKLNVKAGFLEGATYEDGRSVAEVAFFNEYGTAFTPSRPFMRITEKQRRKDWVKAFGKLVRAGILSGDLNAESVYKKMGIVMTEDIRETISSGVPPPNSTGTTIRKILERGADHGTLRDTFTMFRSVDFEVFND